jgi:predicted peptidase
MSAYSLLAAFAALPALLCAGCRSSSVSAGSFEQRMEVEVAGQQLSYRLDVPAEDGRPVQGWPLVLFLHGAGERGDDLTRVAVHGPPKLVEEIPELARCVLVSPQCPADSWWNPASLLALLDEVRASVPVDPARLYVTGLSMGGYGTWNLLARAPELFAAAVPICGGGEIGRLWKNLATGFDLDELLQARDVPIRAFHGADDETVPVEESRLLVRALEASGADVELTVYAGVGHDSWTRTYADPALWTWLFAQRRDSFQGR